MNHYSIAFLVLSSALAGLLGSGCLILADPPKRQYGETCVEDGNCPEGGYCGLPAGAVDAICVPTVAQCSGAGDPVCGAYACEPTLLFCYTSCNSSSECVADASCTGYDYETGVGTCTSNSY
jgi:hypothetical protein